MHQTAIVREALAKGIQSIEGIVRYGMEAHGALVREHTIQNVLRKQATEEEISDLRKENEALRAKLQDTGRKSGKKA